MVGGRRRRTLTMVAFPLTFLWIASLLPFSAQASSDAAALLDFLNGIQHSPNDCLSRTWKSSTSDSSGCPHSWCGVACNSDKYVIALELPGIGLQGTIKPNTLSTITMLSSLDLSNNLLSGNLPDDLGKLTNLQHLNLSYNLFNGSIPVTFNGLQSLTSLNLSFNSFSGLIPPELADLKSLTELDLHSNHLYGEIDPALLTFTSLKVVDISSNKVSGFIPWQPNDTLPLLRTVEYVNLSNNQLTGPLAQARFSSLFAENLRILDLSNNQLSGTLPDFQFVLALESLQLRNNLFTGVVPRILLTGTLGLLEELDLSGNNLTGEITRVLSPSLKVLKLSSNSLSGTLPQKTGRCTLVDLSYNKFYGDLSFLHYWSETLEILNLSFNDLTGGLPDIVSKFVGLRSMDVSHNGLSGSIPFSYGLFLKLNAMDFSFNKLNGTIPGSILNSSSMSYLSLSNNQFVGSLPLQSTWSSASVFNHSPSTLESPSEVQLSQIVVMKLSNNELNGTISEGIGRFQELEELDLSNNYLSGDLPNSLCTLPLLQGLDLSGNLLTGSIPTALPTSLLVLHLSNNNLSGLIPENLRKFPNSSFFPGNAGLSSWVLSPGPKGLPRSSAMAYRKNIGLAVKVGLIGGCLLGFVLVLTVVLLMYSKCPPRTQDYGMGSESGMSSKDTSKGHKLWSPCLACFASADQAKSIPPVVKSSADLLLAPEKTSSASNDKGSPREGTNPWEQDAKAEIDNSSKSAGIEMSTSRARQKPACELNTYHKSSRMAEDIPSSESPGVLKARSPDRLAGDLYFFDKSLSFTVEELSRAPAEVLGRSSHGTSYKATLDCGHVLTVKWLKEGLAKSKKEFAREAKRFCRFRHPNLIPLRGYYWGPCEHEKLILSDFMSPGSLAAHFSDTTGQQYAPLSWQQRLVIAVDIARGLIHLHEERHLPHGNLKATNVLLEGSTFSGRLADYSLYRLMTHEGISSQILNAGALGYRAPELAGMKKPKPSMKGDVYAFGVIMMELLTGKNASDIVSAHCGAVDLTDWIRLSSSENRTIDCFDPSLLAAGKDHEPPKGMDGMLALALKCTSQHLERPNIRSVYEELISISM